MLLDLVALPTSQRVNLDVAINSGNLVDCLQEKPPHRS